MPRRPDLARIGAAAWSLSGGYLLAELLVARASRAPYGTANTISDLGATTCGPLGDAGRLVCSPGHSWMNGAFVVSGLLIAGGALLLRDRLDAGRAAAALLVLTGLSAAAVGLVPVDRFPTAHVAVAAPTFVGRDLALAVLAWRWRRGRPTAAACTALAAAAGTAGALLLGSGLPVGITERLALYPFVVWIAIVGLRWVRPVSRSPARAGRRPRTPGASGPDGR